MDTDPSPVEPTSDPQQPFAWEGSPAPAAQASPPPARSRRARPIIAVAAVLAAGIAALVVALSAGGGSGPAGGGSVVTAGGKRVLLAADVTTREPGAKYTLSVTGSAGTNSVTVHSSGEVNFGPPPSASMEFDVGAVSAHELLVGGDYYLQLSTAAGRWLKVDASSLYGAMGDSPSTLSTATGDPSQTLELLRAAGSVSAEGQETIGGVSTTHYHAVVDLARIASVAPSAVRAAAEQNARRAEQALGSDSLPMDVWIDGQNLVRRLVLALNVPSSGGTVDATATLDFTEYGRQPSVSPPPADEVTDITGQVSSKVAQQLGSGSGG